MSIITKPNTFSAGATIIASEHNSNFDTIYAEFNGNITNSNIAAAAAIADSKLAQITTAQKVNTSALVTTSQAIGDLLYADTATSYTRRATGGANTFLAGGTTPSYRQIAAASDITGTVPVNKGGFGADNSSQPQGYIPYVSSTGVISFLVTGTSGLVLKTNSAGANPSWGNSGLAFVSNTTVTAAAASADITISSTKYYKVVVHITGFSADSIPLLKFNNAGGTAYEYAFTGLSSGNDTITGVGFDTTDIQLGTSHESANPNSLFILYFSPVANSRMVVSGHGTYRESAAGNEFVSVNIGGKFADTPTTFDISIAGGATFTGNILLYELATA